MGLARAWDSEVTESESPAATVTAALTVTSVTVIPTRRTPLPIHTVTGSLIRRLGVS